MRVEGVPDQESGPLNTATQPGRVGFVRCSCKTKY